ncbi:MAG: hypothetical protein JRE14_11140, partial [Deltaproteobacteria bacterium]|nr:hypothetical protein [Deltaproteobacteria bacterium]
MKKFKNRGISLLILLVFSLHLMACSGNGGGTNTDTDSKSQIQNLLEDENSEVATFVSKTINFAEVLDEYAFLIDTYDPDDVDTTDYLYDLIINEMIPLSDAIDIAAKNLELSEEDIQNLLVENQSMTLDSSILDYRGNIEPMFGISGCILIGLGIVGTLSAFYLALTKPARDAEAYCSAKWDKIKQNNYYQVCIIQYMTRNGHALTVGGNATATAIAEGA